MTINMTGRSVERGAEAALVEQAKRDPDAFGSLYRVHYQAITAYLYRRVGDQATAEDLSADTFIAAFCSIRRYRQQGVPFRAWLYRIASNKASRWHAKGGRPVAGSTARAIECESDTENQNIGLVREAIESLGERDKAVLTLAYFTPLGTAQIAQTLGVPEGTVKSRLSRARSALERQIERLGGVS